ncbi:MAG: FecR domain-containing protein [Halomonas sp.]|uniref:FecR domain-containing protein n=1 Tax=Halomonas sp. TaxID=1486246 RepID=UPI003F92BAAE
MRIFSGLMLITLLVVSGNVFSANSSVDKSMDDGSGAAKLYQVQPGDTLWDISERYYGTPDVWRKLSTDNDVPVPIHLQPGEMLSLSPLESSFPGVVTHLTGAVWRVEQGQRVPLREGEQVQAGDFLESSSDGFVAINFADGATVTLPSNTRVTLDKRKSGQGVRVTLVDGEVESRIPRNESGDPHFDVVTPTGNLGVRGTHFRAAYRDDAVTTSGSVAGTTTSVLEGLVDASFSSGQAGVAAGQGAWADGGQFGVVQLLPPPRLQSSTEGLGGSLELMLGYVPGAALYRAQLATDADFYRVVQDVSSDSRQLEFSGLEEGLYHLRLMAVDNKDIEGLPGLEVLFYRPVGAHVEYRQGEWIFHWSSLPRVSYRLQLSVTEDFSAPLVDKQMQSSQGAHVRNLPDGDYYWRVLVSQADEATSQLVGSGRLNAEARNQ